jgi:capsular polysaccharide biosynthesis protein
MLVCAAVVLRELFNDYVVDEADLERKVGIAVIGVIPDVEG